MAVTSALLNSVLPHFVLQIRSVILTCFWICTESRIEDVFPFLAREPMLGVVRIAAA